MSAVEPLSRIDGMPMTTLTASATYWPGPPNPLAALAQSYVARRAFKLVSYCALACLLGVLALVATATLPVLFGYHTYTVDGGSMEPALKRGSVAIAASTNPRALRVGDIIAYRQSAQNPPVLHRIVQITNDNAQLGFITQGDQNQTADAEPVALQGPGDKVMYTVPYAGYILDFAHSTLGKVLLIGVPLPVLLALFLLPGKRTAQVATGSRPAIETRPGGGEGARNSPTPSAERPSLETQALQRGLFSPTMQPVGLTKAPQPSLEAQALQPGLFTPTMRPVGQGRAPQPSLEVQAFERGLLRAVPPAPVKAGPAPQRRAA